MALAGGVNAILSPKVSMFLNDLGMLSASGQCHAFDAAADGFVRGEGCGVVVLKRLSDAEADGDRIWGLVLGTAVNQNGMSAGLMAPNGPAQERVMQDALSRAGVAASDVDYLEAQGVGSQFGDPIELNAVAEVYGQGRGDGPPLYVGSVKTNIGHLEWASGVASLIKTVLAMRRRTIPRHLNFNQPNPHLDWDRLDVQVASEALDWPPCPDRSPLAAVNSFGLSGANAHLVVAGYEDGDSHNRQSWPVGTARPALPANQDLPHIRAQENSEKSRTRLLPLSGKTAKALQDLSARYLSWLNGLNRLPSFDLDADFLADIAWTASIGRSHFPHRAGLVFSASSELLEQLNSLANGAINLDEQEYPGPASLAFVYTGQGRGMVESALYLYETEPIARDILDRCDGLFLKESGLSLLDVLNGKQGTSSNPASAQAAVYAMECAITALWRSVGIVPSIVLGSGLGLISAAHASGALALEDGLRLASYEDFGNSIRGNRLFTDSSSIPPDVTIVVGSDGGVLPAQMNLDISDLVNGMKAQLATSECASALAGLGVDAILEIGAATHSAEAIRGFWRQPGDGEAHPRPLTVLAGLGSLSEDTAPYQDDAGFVSAVARAYEAGLNIAFPGLFAGELRRRVSLPGYPFQRRRHWVDPPDNAIRSHDPV